QRLGAIWFDEGAPLRAAPFLLKSKELVPADLQSRLKLARVLLSVGNRKDSFAEAVSILERAPHEAEAASIAAEAARTPEEQSRVEQALSTMPNEDAAVQLALATSAIRRGDRATAKQAVEKALALDPKSAHAHSFMGTIFLVEKQVSEAGNEFKLAADLSPPRYPERLRYAQFQLQSGAPDEAVKTLHSITSAAPDSLPAWLILGELSLGKKNYDEALKLLANVLNRDPDNIDATVVQARTWAAKGEVDKAVQSLERLDGKYQKFAPLKYELARCYVQKNDSKQAMAALNDALAANPDYLDAAVLLAQLNLRTGNTKAVVESMRPMTEKHPELSVARLLLADAYRALGQLDDAAGIFRDQLKTSPQNAESLLALGIILRQQQKNDEAQKMLEQAQQVAPKNPLPLIQLIDLDLSRRDFAAAERRVGEQLKAAPESALPHFLQGRVYAAQGKFDLAESALTKTLNLNPNFPTAYALLATVYAAGNKLPEAARQLETILARTPNDPRILMSLAVLYEKMHEVAKARETYEKLLTVTPEFAPALNNLAFIYSEQLNDPERAYQLAQKARTLLPNDGAIADTLGWILYRKRDYQQAAVMLAEAVAKTPNDPEIQYHLGMCRYMMGDSDGARNAFEQALKASVDFTNKADAQNRLALLSKPNSGGGPNIKDLESAVQGQRDDVVSRSKLAEAYESAGKFREAAAQYEEVLKLNPRFSQAFVRLANLYCDSLNEPAKALEYAKTARDLSPGDAHGTLLLGRIAYKTGNYSWAYSLLRQISDQLASDPAAIHALGWSAFSLGKVDEATQQMQRVIQISPQGGLADDARTWLAMMEIDKTQRSDAKSAQEVTNVLQKDPGYVPAQLAQAAIAVNNGDPNRAITIYQQVLAHFPDYAPAQKRLATLYARNAGDLVKAYDLGMKARKTLPDDVELTRLLADISYQRKEYDQALKLLEESSRKEPLDAQHLYYMGVCWIQTNDIPHGRDALTRALANGLQDPSASDARRVLQGLK
ncbi:MAG TPA: tetratricopeptide repeat protein, partial [Chthoniobacterales bacterium]